MCHLSRTRHIIATQGERGGKEGGQMRAVSVPQLSTWKALLSSRTSADDAVPTIVRMLFRLGSKDVKPLGSLQAELAK